MNKRTTKNLLFCTGLITTTCIFESNSLEQLKDQQKPTESRSRFSLDRNNTGEGALARLFNRRSNPALFINPPSNTQPTRRSLTINELAASQQNRTPVSTLVNNIEHTPENNTPSIAPTTPTETPQREARNEAYRSQFSSTLTFWKKMATPVNTAPQLPKADPKRAERLKKKDFWENWFHGTSQPNPPALHHVTPPSERVTNIPVAQNEVLTVISTPTTTPVKDLTPAPVSAPTLATIPQAEPAAVVSEINATPSASVSSTSVVSDAPTDDQSNPTSTPVVDITPSPEKVRRLEEKPTPNAPEFGINQRIIKLSEQEKNDRTPEKSPNGSPEKEKEHKLGGKYRRFMSTNASSDSLLSQLVGKLTNHHSKKKQDDGHTVRPSEVLADKTTDTTTTSDTATSADTTTTTVTPEVSAAQDSTTTTKDIGEITPDNNPNVVAIEPTDVDTTDTTSPTQIFDEENPAPTPSEVSEPTPTSVNSVTDESSVEPTPEVTPIGHPTESPSEGSDSQPSSSASETDIADETDAQPSGSDSSVTDTSSATLITVDAPTDELVAESTAPVEPLSSNDSTDSNESPTESTSDSADDKVELPQSESAPLQDASPSQDDQLPVDQTTEPTGSNYDASSTSVVAEAETPTPVEGGDAPTLDQTPLEDQDDSSASSSDIEAEGENLGADEGAPAVDQDDSSSSSSDSEDEKRDVQLKDTASKEEVASASSSPKGSLDEPRSAEGTPKSTRRSFMSKLNPAKMFRHKRTESDASGTSTPPATESGSISPDTKKQNRLSVRFVLDQANKVLHRKKDKKASESTAEPTAPATSPLASQGSDGADLVEAFHQIATVNSLLPGTSLSGQIKEGVEDVAGFVAGSITDVAAEIKEKVDDIIHHHDTDSAATSEATQSASEPAPVNVDATPIVTEEPQVEQSTSTPVSADETTTEAPSSTPASTEGAEKKDLIDDVISTLWLPNDSSPWHFPNPDAPDSRALPLEPLPANSIESASTATSEPVELEPIPSSSSAEVSRAASLEERGADEKGDNKYKSKDEKKSKEKNKKEDKEKEKNKDKSKNKKEDKSNKVDQSNKKPRKSNSILDKITGIINKISSSDKPTNSGNVAPAEALASVVENVSNIVANGNSSLAPTQEVLEDGTVLTIYPTNRPYATDENHGIVDTLADLLHYKKNYKVGPLDYIFRVSDDSKQITDLILGIENVGRIREVGLEKTGSIFAASFPKLNTLDLTKMMMDVNEFNTFIGGFNGGNSPLTVLKASIVDDEGKTADVNHVKEVFPNIKSLVIRGQDLLVAPVVDPTPTVTVATLTTTEPAPVDNVVPSTPVEAAPTETVTAPTTTDSATQVDNQ